MIWEYPYFWKRPNGHSTDYFHGDFSIKVVNHHTLLEHTPVATGKPNQQAISAGNPVARMPQKKQKTTRILAVWIFFRKWTQRIWPTKNDTHQDGVGDVGVCLGATRQLMVNCWFGARWFGILRVPLSNNPFHKGILGIQTTGPQTNNWPLVESRHLGFAHWFGSHLLRGRWSEWRILSEVRWEKRVPGCLVISVYRGLYCPVMWGF